MKNHSQKGVIFEKKACFVGQYREMMLSLMRE